VTSPLTFHFALELIEIESLANTCTKPRTRTRTREPIRVGVDQKQNRSKTFLSGLGKLTMIAGSVNGRFLGNTNWIFLARASGEKCAS